MTSVISLRRTVVNAVMLGATGVCTVFTVGILLFILGYLVVKGGSSISWSFFVHLPAPAGEPGGGMGNAILGSAKVLLLAAAFGLPIGFLAGVYVAEYGGPASASSIRFIADVLNGVPSILIGVFIYAVIVLKTRHFSTFAGGMALGVMMIPIALRSTEQFLRAVPDTLREGALALGATKARTIVTVVAPAAMPGILSGMLLNVARVAGETAPLLFTALNNQFWSPGWGEPTATLPVMIFTYAIAPYPDWHRQAWAAVLVLLAVVLLINVSARSIAMAGSTRKFR
jgi:phosphate transport system permease protein